MQTARRKGRMEHVIDGAAGGLGRSIGFASEHWILFGIFAVLWVAFAAALVLSQGSLDDTWSWIRDQHLVVQGLIWILFLPVTAGLWVWETTWPLILRLVVVGGLAGWTLLVMIPKAAEAAGA
jgi:hypothetical protein